MYYIEKEMYKLYTDGGCRGNNNSNKVDTVCGGGAVIYDEHDKELFSKAERFHDLTTNNESEWKSLVIGLQMCVDNNIPISEVQLFADSNLVIQQYLGFWKIREPRLMAFYVQAKKFGKVFSAKHVPRAQNKRADQLSNIGMSM